VILPSVRKMRGETCFGPPLKRCMCIRDQALSRIGLLQEVAQFKMRFYRCPWAKYEEARPGSLRLLPPGHHIDELRKDYLAMQGILFGTIPSFEEIATGLAALEKTINDQSLSAHPR
jgi:hypothetical protein